MVRVAVIEVALTIVTFEAVTPVPDMFRLADPIKFVPVSVTFTGEPCAPDEGAMLLRVGAGGSVTLNGNVAVVPFVVVTETL
jgi:hypothetical protein